MAHAFPGQRAAHLHGVRPIASDGYDRVSDPSMLARFVVFLNTADFLDFARELTGATDICRVNAQATCFRPGHFFGFHTDAEVDDQQRATAIFCFTPHWQQEWGGLLQFKDDHHDEIAEIFMPTFNSLGIFSYQQDHAVSVVAPTCQAPRFAIAAALMGI
jgi:Rps23 Pro-64 3,4-dihydroxylase Tpa1-like proline 4-hydroxylase